MDHTGKKAASSHPANLVHRHTQPGKRTSAAPCVVSVSEHAGWAHLVCVATAGDVPCVIDRRRVTLLDDGLPRMPYHHDTLRMREDEANALIARVRRSIDARTSTQLRRVMADLTPAHAVVALAIRKPPFTDLPESVADVWRSYRLQCTADGVMYQQAMCRAAQSLGMEVDLCPRGEEAARAAGQLGLTPDEIESFVTTTGRPPGPPWTEEHRRAFAAGIATLAAHSSAKLRIAAARS